MELKTIYSYNDLQSEIEDHNKHFLLLYKKGSDKSDCALSHLAKVDYPSDLLTADVVSVRDIHNLYSITSVPSLLEFQDGKLKNIIKGCQTLEYYSSLFNRNSSQSVKKNTGEKPAKRVKVYSTPTCPWCTRVKDYLRSQNIRFTDVDVSKNQSAANAMVSKSGQRGVPQTEINGRMVIGFDKNKIDLLLNLK